MFALFRDIPDLRVADALLCVEEVVKLWSSLPEVRGMYRETAGLCHCHKETRVVAFRLKVCHIHVFTVHAARAQNCLGYQLTIWGQYL